MAVLDIKLKSYDELTMEITRLNTQLLLMQKTNEDLQEMLLDKEDDLDIYIRKICKAKQFIEENSVNFGKYKVMIQENDELQKNIGGGGKGMTLQEANRLIKKILKSDCVEAGIFISMLSYEYMEKFNVSEKNFLRSLKNSIKVLGSDDDE